MGTGHSIDTPVRVAHLGIASVISIVDDVLIEKLRRYYAELHGVAYTAITKRDPHSRSRRIKEYLNLVQELVSRKLEAARAQRFFADNDKARYFELLPDASPLRVKYNELLRTTDRARRGALEEELSAAMRAGSIDVNIMAKVDRQHYADDGALLADDVSEARSGLRGFAESALSSSLILSAGFNRGLIAYLAQFADFYRTQTGSAKKKIILKVSDFRSALVQGKYLAMKGLEVSEYRIESGLNCGGHAFATQGMLMPAILKEFDANRTQLVDVTEPLVRSYYREQGFALPSEPLDAPLITVQGGIGTSGEAQRLMNDLGCDATGWGSPFLLVPEATCVDVDTRAQLMSATRDDLYLSGVSPLGVPFNNLRGTGSERWTTRRIDNEKPGSACGRGFLVSNTEFTATPICTASNQYQTLKLAAIGQMMLSDEEKEQRIAAVTEKTCLCEHLGNGALINLGIADKTRAPQAVCPGPNIVWFDREYTLREMVDHIYGRGESLISPERPHMFCQEIELNVTYFENLQKTMERDAAGAKYLDAFRQNLEDGMDLCEELARRPAYPNENLASIAPFVRAQRERLRGCTEYLSECA